MAQVTKFFPKIESTNEDWGGVSLYDLALKLLSTSPFADTLETVGVVAVGQDPKAALTGVGFLIDHLHADPTYHVLAALHSERELHVLLMGLNARLQERRQRQRTVRLLQFRDSTVKSLTLSISNLTWKKDLLTSTGLGSHWGVSQH